MAENDLPTGTTEPATGTTAQAADGSATAPADGSGSSDSIETLRAQLAEAQRKTAQLLSEKTNVEQEREELRQERQSRQSPPPTQGVDPYVQQMQTLNAIVLRYGIDSFEGQMAQANALALQQSRQAATIQAFSAQVERDLLKIPAEHRDDVKARMYAGEFDTVTQAYEATKGSKSGQTIEALQRELAELKAKLAGPAPQQRVANVSTAVRTQIDAATHARIMTRADANRIYEKGGAAAAALMAQEDSGEVIVRD